MTNFGWSLPPGCRESDIPGNRPREIVAEKFWNDYWDGKALADWIEHKYGVRPSDAAVEALGASIAEEWIEREMDPRGDDDE